MKNSLLSGFVLAASVSLLGSGSVVAADNCTGTFKNVPGTSETIDVANGGKITFFNDRGTIDSGDSGYIGGGGCAGVAYAMPDGKGWAAGSCSKLTASGDNWTYSFYEDFADNGKGKWQGLAGTGQFAKNARTSGWYQTANMSDQGSDGTWGGNCPK